MSDTEKFISYVRELFHDTNSIPLHEPRLFGNEKKYVIDAIDSTFVSSVGQYVDRFEAMICKITGAKYAIATVNGTCALHVALELSGVRTGEEVITQPLSFVATANAIVYCKAEPIFLDVNLETLGLDPVALEDFLKSNAQMKEGSCYNSVTGNRIAACIPVHTFGHP